MRGWVNGEEEFVDLVAAEAAELIRSHGAGAYSKAREAWRRARDDGDPGLEKFYSKVSQAVAERQAVVEMEPAEA